MNVNLQFSFSDFTYNAPIIVQKRDIKTNKILSVKISINENQNVELIGTVDLCALPNFHNHNVLEWKYVLETFFKEHEFDFSRIELTRPFFNTTTSEKSFDGELLAIVETILFAIIEKKFPEQLSAIEKKPVKLNALYSPDIHFEEIPECLKIKIRPNPINLTSTITVINQLREKKASIRFRLDGNRCFNLIELENFLMNLKEKCGPLETMIEYIEEPFKNYSDTLYFAQKYTIPLAIDESLISYKDTLFKIPKNTFLIAKPSLLGISKTFEILNTFREKVIISSSYETASASRALLYLAAMNPGTCHGLDTQKFLPKYLSIKETHFCLPF